MTVEENTKSAAPQPADEYIIDDLETLKVVSDPLRLQILQLLAQQPRTVKELAADLDVPPTKLYYHINLMEKHNLIQVVETRIVSGIVEKQYLRTAFHYRIQRGLLSPGADMGDETLNRVLTTLLDDTRQDIRRAAHIGLIDLDNEYPPNRMALMIQREVARMSPERADEFHQRVLQLVRDFQNEDPDPTRHKEGQGYALVAIWYPTARARLNEHPEG